MKARAKVIEVIVEQHADDAAFHWVLRDLAVTSPHYTLTDLAELDNTLEAHMDALRLAGDAGWTICREALAYEEPGEVFTAALLAFESGLDDRVEKVLEVGCDEPELERGLASACAWLPYVQARPLIERFVVHPSSQIRRLGIAASALHRQNPGNSLALALNDGDSRLVARAIRAVAELGLSDFLPVVQSHLHHEDPSCRFWAAWVGALHGQAAALPVLQALVENQSPYSPKALDLVLRCLPPAQAKAWWRQLAGMATHLRLAVIGAGVLGDSSEIPWLIDSMENPMLARVAGEAIAMVSGVDLAYEDLEGEAPEGFEAGPSEDPEDVDVSLDPDENLAWPDPDLLRAWWREQANQLPTGVRLLLGKPITQSWLTEVLRSGFQRQRMAAALELSRGNLAQPLFEVRAAGFRQAQWLAGP